MDVFDVSENYYETVRMYHTLLKVILLLKKLIMTPKKVPPSHEVFNIGDFYILNIYTANMSEHGTPLQTLHHHHHQGLGSLSFSSHSRSHGNFTDFQ